MNALDLLAIAVIIISSSIGLYEGFIVSFAGLFAFFASFIGALIFYPVFSRFLLAKTGITSIIADLLGSSVTPAAEISNSSIDSFAPSKFNNLLNTSDLPSPFLGVLERDFANQAYKTMGTNQIGIFLSTSISNLILNIISFLILLLIIRILIGFIISGFKYMTNIPVLKQFDSLFGLAFGFIRGFFFNFVVFALLIVGLSFAPIPQLYGLVDKSYFAKMFYNSNMIISVLNSIL
ncbi:MAG: CvpA family protein [Clostridia bacterium]|nr:CvpA family protein [Clostridia bacterium]